MSTVLNQIRLSHFHQMEIRAGDLTEEHVDVIVNAANHRLIHGAGVAKAISRKGGKSIQRESSAWIQQHGMIDFDHPAYTRAGALPCHFVIHAVGPVWGEGQEEEKLHRTILGALDLATQLEAKTLAIPPISTGIFGFPKEKAAPIFFETIHEFWATNSNGPLMNIRIVIIDEPTISIFLHKFEGWKRELGNDDYASE